VGHEIFPIIQSSNHNPHVELNIPFHQASTLHIPIEVGGQIKSNKIDMTHPRYRYGPDKTTIAMRGYRSAHSTFQPEKHQQTVFTPGPRFIFPPQAGRQDRTGRNKASGQACNPSSHLEHEN
jgi:hypothetical protein